MPAAWNANRRRPQAQADFGSTGCAPCSVRPCSVRDTGLRGSIGRVGTCADNAGMESFLSLLQKNVINRRRWATREELRLAIVVWIDKTYHRRRCQDAPGRLTSIEFQTLHQAADAA
jgi:putative transposase